MSTVNKSQQKLRQLNI